MIVDIENKNPFNILMGLLLKYYRLEKKLTSKEIAQRLNSGHSLYRLIEAGNSPLHPNKIFLLINLFEDLFEDADIEFDNLSKFLISGQYIDSLVNRKQRATSRGLTYKEAIQELLNNDTVGFAKLLKNTSELFNSKTSKDRLHYFVSEKAPMELFDFLSINNYQKPKTEQHKDSIINTIYDSYSLHIEILMSMAREFKSHPPLHITGIADKWEKENKRKFTHLRGFYLKEDIIVNDENFKLFNYQYLFEDKFKELKMVFVSEKSSKKLKNDFIDGLNKSRKNNGLAELTENEINKISFKTINKKTIDDRSHSLIKENKNSIKSKLLAYWSFSMISGNHNGFVGYRDDDNERDYVLNLKYGDALERVNKFEEEWENID